MCIISANWFWDILGVASLAPPRPNGNIGYVCGCRLCNDHSPTACHDHKVELYRCVNVAFTTSGSYFLNGQSYPIINRSNLYLFATHVYKHMFSSLAVPISNFQPPHWETKGTPPRFQELVSLLSPQLRVFRLRDEAPAAPASWIFQNIQGTGVGPPLFRRRGRIFQEGSAISGLKWHPEIRADSTMGSPKS